MPDITRALEQIDAIHDHIARGKIYRGWRPVPVAASGAVGLAAAAWQAVTDTDLDPVGFAVYWLAVALVAFVVGCSEIVWHYFAHADSAERRQSRLVMQQLLPALGGGAVLTGALLRPEPALVGLLPGLWALLFGMGVFAARAYVPDGSRWVALYFWTAGLLLLSISEPATPSPWAVGVTFGVGQLIAAVVLHITRDRLGRRPRETTS